MSDVFISYSRQEQAFADKLAQELEKNNRSVWIDRVRIELTSDWWEEIKRGIEASDNFVLIMSPSSMASPVCHLEIEYALQLTKRIIPLYHLDHSKSDTKTRFGDRLDSDDFLLTLYGDRNPMALFEENWSVIPAINRVEAQVTATQGDDDGLPMRFDEQEFSAFFTHLRQAIDTDIAHVHQHTRLLTRTRDWRLADEKASFLLNPVETDEAEGWLQDWEADRDARAERNLPPKNPQPDEQMRRFIATSRIVVDQELRRQRNLQRATVIFAIVGVLSIVAVIGSLVNLNATQQQASTAQAQADDAQVRADNAQDQVATANNALTQVPPTLTEVGAQVLSARNQADQANAELTSIPPTLTQVNEQVVTAEGQIQVASTQVAQANDELNAVLPTLTQVNQTVQDSLLQIDALGLVGLGQQQIQAGNTRTAAWLALRSFALLPTSQGRDLLAEVDQRPLPITESFMGDMVDINADGTLAVGAWFDEGRQIRLYQLPDMTQIASLVDDSEASIGALAISPDGQYVAVSGDDGEAPETWLVTVFDASSGELLYRTEAFDAPVVALAFSPDNRRLALGLRDPDTEGNEAVIEWDVAENEEIRRYQGVYHSALSLAYSPDGAWLAVGEVYGTVAIFDMATGERIQRLNVQFYGLLSSTQTRVVRFSDDSQRLAVSAGTIFLSAGEDWVVKVYDTRTWEDIVTIPTFNVLTNDLDFSQDNRLLLGAQNNGWVNIWNAGTGELLSRLDAHNGNRFIAVNSDIVNTAFLFDDELVLSVDARGNRSYIWQMRSTQELEDTAGETQYIDFDPNGRLLLSSDGLPRARIINPLTRQREGSFPVYKALFSPDGELVISGFINSVSLFNAQTGQFLEGIILPEPGNAEKLALSADGRYISTFIDGNQRHAIYDIEQERWIYNRAVRRYQYADTTFASFHPSRPEFVFTNVLEDPVVISNIEDQSFTTLPYSPDESGAFIGIEYTQDGERFVSVEGDGDVYIWSANEATLINSFALGINARSYALNPAGTVLALGTERGDVFLHDLQTGELLQSIDAHEEIVTALAYTPDGNQLISASSREQRLRYWFTSDETYFTYMCERVALLPELTDDELARFSITEQVDVCR